MSLTVGAGPFGQAPSGRFDFEPPRQVWSGAALLGCARSGGA